MKRLPFATLLVLAVACKSDPTPGPESSAAPSNPHAASGSAAPGAPAAPVAQAPIAHGTNPTQAQTAPRPLEKLADGRFALGPFSLTVPAGWTEKPSTMSMRAAQFQLPADQGEAEVIVYYFGETGAGSVQANIDRWVGQFKQPDDKPSKDVAKIEKASFAGQEASVISVSGRLVASPMPGAPPVDKPDQSLVAAIVPSPSGPYYFRLVGASKTVAAQEAAYRQMLSSLTLR